MTMSTSSAPSRTDRAASNALTSLWCLPDGKPHTVATSSPRSRVVAGSRGSIDGETHTE
ncbi:Uncharacterised protein [Mycobacteroides abscessus]|nr:Uncharacterised protein [Mycobacteroides abscessus]